MSIFLIILTAVLIASQVWLDYAVKYIYKDGRTGTHKAIRKWLVVVTLLVFFISLAQGIQKDREYATKIDSLNTNVWDLNLQLGHFTTAIATNSRFDPVLRSEALQVRKTLPDAIADPLDPEVLSMELNNKQNENQKDEDTAEQNENRVKKALLDEERPMLEYAIDKFKEDLLELRKKVGGDFKWDIAPIPENTPGTISLGEASIGTNTVWQFKILITVPQTYNSGNRPAILIEYKSGACSVDIGRSGENVCGDVVVSKPGWKTVPTFRPYNEYKSFVDETIRYLFAATANSIPSTHTQSN